jgi:Protein of unknown function (DUF3096)
LGPAPLAAPCREAGVFIVTVSLLVLQPLVALIAGVLILAVPRLLNYIVALYLIIVGVTGLWPHLLH